MRIIFLDIDGVFNSELFYNERHMRRFFEFSFYTYWVCSKVRFTLNSTCSICCINIHGKMIYCIYSRKSIYGKKRLKTVIENNHTFPTPKSLGVRGVDSKMFETEIDLFIKEVHELAGSFRLLGQKEFYKSNTELNTKLKKAVKDYVLKGTFDINLAVMYVIEKYANVSKRMKSE